MNLFSRNKTNERWARVLSRVFDPILVIPLMLILAVGNALLNGESFYYLGLLILLDALVPGFVLLYFVQKGKISSGWDVTRREERVKLFWFVVLTHLVGVLGAWLLGKHPLAEFLSVFWLMSVVYALITMKWKISVHTGVMSGLVTFLVLTQGRLWSWFYVLVLMVVWARVIGRYHRLAQALAGAAVPIVLMPVLFWMMGMVG